MIIKKLIYSLFAIVLINSFFIITLSMRKTGNLLIRDATKKTARESLPVLNSTTSISGKNEQK